MAVALGSSTGERTAHLATALRALDVLLDGLVVGPLYASRPEGAPPGAEARDTEYLNTAVVGSTRLAADQLLAELKRLEHAAGRRLAARNAPRPLDLDLLLYGELESRRPELTVPHPRLTRRAFVLAPLAAIAPDWPVPPAGETVAELLADLGGDVELRPVAWPREPLETDGPPAAGSGRADC